MKEFIFFARVYTWLTFAYPLAVTAQVFDTYPNYVVIGAFAQHKNAINFTDDANRNNFPAQFQMNPNRNLYYVYVLTTADRALAIAEAIKLRAETKYFDTWVYSGVLGEALTISGEPDNHDLDPVTGQRIESVQTEQNNARTDSSPQNLVEKTGAQNLTDVVRNDTFSPALKTEESGDEATQPSGRRSKQARKQNARTASAEDSPGADTPLSEGQSNNQVVDEQSSMAIIEEQHDATTDRPRQAGGGVQAATQPHRNDPVVMAENAQSINAENNFNAVEEGEADIQADPSTNEISSTDPGQEQVASAALPAPVKASTEPLQTDDVAGKDFFFHLARADNHKTIPGEVVAIDFERSRKMATYPANEAVSVQLPSTDSKHISFVCQVFGYRKQQKEFEPASPPEDLYLDEKGNLVVPFELVRLQKGDIAIMYNVFFFKDAAVMRPESRYEVNNLLELLKENPTYNIVIHGHTNGNAGGRIIRMDTPGNFYSLSGTKQGFGSAKKLSEERALVIRDFLNSSGIPEGRMDVKAWGGRKPLHDKHSVRANENVRVEIEILSK